MYLNFFSISLEYMFLNTNNFVIFSKIAKSISKFEWIYTHTYIYLYTPHIQKLDLLSALADLGGSYDHPFFKKINYL